MRRQRKRLMLTRGLASPSKAGTGLSHKQENVGSPRISGINTLLHLQRTHGNAFVRRLLQGKLSVSQPGEKYEQKSDGVANHVMRLLEVGRGAGLSGGAGVSITGQGAGKAAHEQKWLQVNSPMAQIKPLVQRQPMDDAEKALLNRAEEEKEDLAKQKSSGPNGEQEEELQKTTKIQRAKESSPAIRKGGEPGPITSSIENRNVRLKGSGRRQSRTIHQSGGVEKATSRTIQRKIGDGHDLTSARFSGNAVLEAVFDNERTLKNGHSGTAVQIVQQALVDLNYELPRFGVDSDFGAETEAAVKAFQVDTGAAVDGVVGPQTMGFLDARVQGQPVAAAPAPVVGAALPAANVIVQPGAAPSIALGACTWGLTFPENVNVDFVAVQNGANWVPVVSGLTGNYSLQARLLPAQTEVTGPGGNTNAGNFCAQVRELNALGNCPGVWYMRSAVVTHERVHATRFRPGLVAAAPAIEAAIEAVTVPDVPGRSAATAAAAIRALPAFAAAVTNAQALWLAQILALVAGDHAAGGPTDRAEHTIVDPMVRRICAHARRNGWPACSPPC